jgi:DNA-directed RNA polymerase specialized sigma24 family protein
MHVSQPNVESIRATWQQMSRRNDWILVGDQEAFLHSVANELSALPEDAPLARRIQVALLRAYGALLYRGLHAQQERAAYELWLACYRLALRDGWTPADAEVLAQESMTRVLEKVHTLRAPESIISWSLKIYQSVRTSSRKQSQAEESIQPGDQAIAQVAVAADMAAEVEQQLLTVQLLDLMRAKVPNELERLVLLRVVIQGDHPRDVARDLNLPLHRTRLAKSRALQRLRGDPQFLQVLSELAGENAQQVLSAGAYDNDTETN